MGAKADWGGLPGVGEPPRSAPRPRPKAGFAMRPKCRKGRDDVNVKRVECGSKVYLFVGQRFVRIILVSKKSGKIALLIDQFRGREMNPYYLGYFACFNQQLFYEAHDVLEELWLPDRKGSNGDFFKGLIQLAGAFVHLQKNRLKPAAALFRLARTNLEKYPERHERLDIPGVLRVIEAWLQELESQNFQRNPLFLGRVPELSPD